MFRFVTLSSVAIFIAHLHLSEGYDVVPVEADGGVALEQYQCLYQTDFNNGTKIITEPGFYKLCEDISFFPQVNVPEEVGAAEAFEPHFDGPYDNHAFGLGFFAALSIACPNVTLNLNGYTIEQSAEHALLQRFFAVIELADSPFIKGAGPAEFISESKNQLNAASNIEILGPGTIGRSSHHGIHGNENNKIVIKDVTFVDFEVAAVSINNVNRVEIKRCRIKHNRHDVPVLGMFSAAKFISPYGKKLKELNYSMNIRGVSVSASDVYTKLVDSINAVYDDVKKYGFISKSEHPMEYELFHNPHRVVDGPCYAFVVHGKGPAVGDFGFSLSDKKSQTSRKVIIKNNRINKIKCWTNEVPAIVEDDKVMTDTRGAILQLIRSSDHAPIAINDDGTYMGNVVADMQIMVAKAIHDGVLKNQSPLQTLVNSINPTIVNWASSSNAVYKPKYRCNGDSMHHVNKGMTMIRVEDAVGFNICRNVIGTVRNLSPPAFDNCYDYNRAIDFMTVKDESSLQQGANIRGISVSAVTGYKKENSSIVGNKMKFFRSDEAAVIIGIDMQGKCDSTSVFRNQIDLAGSRAEGEDDKYISIRFSQQSYQNVVSTNNQLKQQAVKSKRTVIPSRRCPGMQLNEWPVGSTPGGSCPFASKLQKNISS